jgi:hypothetical protein
MPYHKALACDEWTRLLLECSKAARYYSDAVTIMGAAAQSSNPEEYGQAWDGAERCRVFLKSARLALNQHTAEHKCANQELGAQI